MVFDAGVDSMAPAGEVCESSAHAIAFKSIYNRCRSILRPTRERRVTKLLSEAAECYAVECDGPADAARRLLMFLQSLDDVLTYWEEDLQCREKAYVLIGLRDDCMEHLRQAVAQALELMDRQEYGTALGCLSNAPLFFAGEEDVGDFLSAEADDVSRKGSSFVDSPDASSSDEENAISARTKRNRYKKAKKKAMKAAKQISLEVELVVSNLCECNVQAPSPASDDLEELSTCDELGPHSQVDTDGPRISEGRGQPECLLVSDTSIHFKLPSDTPLWRSRTAQASRW